jgi:hypothetical protein
MRAAAARSAAAARIAAAAQVSAVVLQGIWTGVGSGPISAILQAISGTRAGLGGDVNRSQATPET